MIIATTIALPAYLLIQDDGLAQFPLERVHPGFILFLVVIMLPRLLRMYLWPALEVPSVVPVMDSIGAPGEIRTPGLLVRSQPLYPTELRAHKGEQLRKEYPHVTTSSSTRPSPR